MNCKVRKGSLVIAVSVERAALPSRVQAAAILAACLISTSACRDKPERPAPPTYPVTGTVASPDGRSLAGGCVEFKLYDNPELTATGVIDATGKFSLSIPFVDRIIPGAVEGIYQVYVVMPLGANRKSGGYVPIEGEFKVRPTENRFTIKMPHQ